MHDEMIDGSFEHLYLQVAWLLLQFSVEQTALLCCTARQDPVL